MTEKNQESQVDEDWENIKARIDGKVEMIDEINRMLRRKNLEELREIREGLKSGR